MSVHEFSRMLLHATRDSKVWSWKRQRIDGRGWDAFSRVLCDTSSLEAANKSNHVLVRLWRLSIGTTRLPDDVLSSLKANGETNKTNTIRKKIVCIYLRGNFDVSSFREMNIGTLLLVLGQIGKEYLSHQTGVRRRRSSALYRILRNIPELCSFPSTERKLRPKLKEENAAVRAENKLLKEKVEQLLLENDELKRNKCRKEANARNVS